MIFTRVFVLERKFTHAWGAQAVFWGEHRSREALQWHRASYFVLGAQSSLGGHLSRLGGTSSDLGEGAQGPEITPSPLRGAWPGYIKSSIQKI